MSLKKITNLTDVPNPILKRRGLVNVSLKVGDRSLAPGKSDMFRITPSLMSEVLPYLSVMAACVGDPPKRYLEAKAKAQAQPTEEIRPPPGVSTPPTAPVEADEFIVEDAQVESSQEETEEPSSIKVSEYLQPSEGSSKRRRKRR